ncbi:MAG: VCBS repeat-containing protein [Bacteroidota bacterium]
MRYGYLFLLTLSLIGCGDPEPKTLFVDVAGEKSGVEFTNTLTFDKDFNIFTYRNFYNGGGVGLGDINNDGLLDIYFTGNQVKNKLFLNKGNLQFEDITEKAGVAGERAWSTGVSIVDVNGDGYADIYVCNSGDIEGDNKQNELYINNGDLTFSEEAEKYNLADKGFSTHAAFLDYDKDGDLDLYLLNNSYAAIGSFNLMKNIRPERDSVGGDKLFRNDNNVFVDVSEEAGIYGSIIGFGLGITIGDINDDGWQDIFISNDFFEKDYLYINNQDGTFSESLENSMRSISAASMGADMADINNDLKPDIFVTDMLPEPLERIKQVTTFESWDKFKFKKDNGYYNQFSRNMLHVNNGNGSFSELGRLAGVEATDWSWGALIFDMDNDGLKDLFIANGIYQDITDLDYLNFIADDETKRKIVSSEGVDYKALTDPIPVNPVPNYAYRNKGELSFENKAEDWGLGTPGHSNGSAYGDLDNDGDLDLVVSNVNAGANIFINQSELVFPENSFLKVKLMAEKGSAIGAKVYLSFGDNQIYQELVPSRGFQSTVDDRLNFGVGNTNSIDIVKVVWPSGKVSSLKDIQPGQEITVKELDATIPVTSTEVNQQAENQVLQPVDLAVGGLKHQENYFLDYNRDRLLYHRRSTEGPAFAKADIDGDGTEELFLGGAKGFAGKVLKWTQNRYDVVQEFENEKNSEDTDAFFGDFNSDGSIDLLVTSGGNEFGLGDPPLANRLYLNDGNGKFTLSQNSGFGIEKKSTSTIAVIDFDQDGDMDVFFGERLRPFLFGIPCDGGIWINDGNGQFANKTNEIASDLKALGMITDAVWADIDLDGDQDLMVTGEWMEITSFINEGGKLKKSVASELNNKKGWWNKIAAEDIDGDGDIDFVVGNHGKNTRFKADADNPLTMFVNDFDQNGSVEHVFCRKQDTTYYPITLKHELVAQMPGLKKKFLKYTDYNSKSLAEIFSGPQFDKTVVSELNYLESVVLINDGKANFTVKSLPWQSQVSPVYAICIKDINEDGNKDLIIGGNLSGVKPEMGQYDASYGQLLIGKGGGEFQYMDISESGLSLRGDVRHISSIEPIAGKNLIMIVKNNDAAEVYEIR